MITPAFSNDALDRHQYLVNLIRQDIVEMDGVIPFSHFMSRALYTPAYGYYMSDQSKIGAQGDFITAPEISPLLAQCLAQQCVAILKEYPQGEIFEIGAGTGALAVELLLWLEKENSLPARYLIFDVSPDCRRRQRDLFAARCPHLLSRIVWLEALPVTPIQGVIIANEVLDALPVDCFEITETGLQERGVTWENDHFAWQHFSPEKSVMIDQLEAIALPLGYQSEMHINIPDWIHSVANSLEKGVIFLLDYGYGRSEYYHPDRSCGTLMCYCQHQRADNPFENVGLQDITAHVDFTCVIESAMEAGCSLGGFTTQAGFLLSSGLMEKAEDRSALEQFRYAADIKKLILPHEMGEAVKVMALTKSSPKPLSGFSLQDRRWGL